MAYSTESCFLHAISSPSMVNFRIENNRIGFGMQLQKTVVVCTCISSVNNLFQVPFSF